MRLRSSLAALITAGLLVSGCALQAAPAPGTAAGDRVPTSLVMDRDRNKVFDTLDQVMATAGDKDLIPVLIMARGPGDLPQLERVAGQIAVAHRYKVVPALAANVTKDQVGMLSRQDFVRHIEYDAEVRITMDGAAKWSGVSKARTDFGVTGDRDGSAGYSKVDIVVAVIDTGIDPAHVDLDGGKVIGWKDWVNARTSAYDDQGHGTHVAGIVAGTGDANAAFRGVAPGAALVGLKVLDSSGSGTLSNVAAAVDWAVENREQYGIRIISMSLGTSGSSDGTDTVSLAVNRAAEAGIVPVVAAGNSGPNKYTIGAPGAAEKAVTVAAMADPAELGFGLAGFSSRGPSKDDRMKPEISAPGVNIMAPKANTSNQYVSYSGTSMATPFVSGSIALILDANPNLTVAQVRDLLRSTAQDWGPAGQDIDYGWGRLDAWAAVKAAGSFSGGSAPPVPGHRTFTGSLSGSSARAEHSFTVSDTSYPVSVTLLMPGWTGTSTPDFDLHLIAPDGTELGKATGTSRQEQVSKKVTQTGVYKAQVRSYAGGGEYILDVSAGMTGGADQLPVVGVEQPAEGATVSGTLDVKVKATDDGKVAKVEIALDSGAYTDITATYDGALYHYQWNTAAGSNGDHTLTARATDNAGQQSASVRKVTVANGAPPPPPQSHEVTRTGQVTAGARDVSTTFQVHATGYVDLTLGWNTSADLDLYVYAPDGSFVGRAFTLNKPERLRVDTARWGTGKYTAKVSLYGGADSSFTLTAKGYRMDTYTGTVSPTSRDSVQERTLAYTGRGRVTLSWQGGSDLDFYVSDPGGRERGRAFTLQNPEQLDVNMDVTGTWKVRVNLYGGSGGAYTLRIYAPEAVLS